MNKTLFKIWDNKYKFFYDNDSVFLTPNGKLYGNTDTGYNELLRDVTISRFTGLKDRTGHDIFEGDIIIVNDYYKRYINNKKLKVIYSLDGGSVFPFAGFTITSLWEPDLENRILLDCILCQSCKIIGNVFENSELLVTDNLKV